MNELFFKMAELGYRTFFHASQFNGTIKLFPGVFFSKCCRPTNYIILNVFIVLCIGHSVIELDVFLCISGENPADILRMGVLSRSNNPRPSCCLALDRLISKPYGTMALKNSSIVVGVRPRPIYEIIISI